MSSMVDGDKRKKGDGCKHKTGERIKTCRFWHFQKRFGVEDGWRDGQTGEDGGGKGQRSYPGVSHPHNLPALLESEGDERERKRGESRREE